MLTMVGATATCRSRTPRSLPAAAAPAPLPTPFSAPPRLLNVLDLLADALELRLQLDDVLRAIARSVVPDDTHSVHIELSPFTGAVRVDPHRGFAEEVRLRMTIEAMTTARASLVDGVEIDRLATITQRLEELGCRRR